MKSYNSVTKKCYELCPPVEIYNIATSNESVMLNTSSSGRTIIALHKKHHLIMLAWLCVISLGKDKN